MAALPSWAWLVVGLLLAGTSWYLEGLTLFFWLGWLFIAIGTARFLYVAVTRKKESPTEKRILHQAAAPSAHQHYRCHCGNVVRKTDNFCSWCGRRLR